MIYGLILKLEISLVESIISFLIRAVIQILSTSLIVLNHVKLHALLFHRDKEIHCYSTRGKNEQQV